MYRGLSRRSIHLSEVAIMPGPGTGADSAGQIQPAFTSAAPRPVCRASTSVTRAPSVASWYAVVRPMAPPPMTTTC